MLRNWASRLALPVGFCVGLLASLSLGARNSSGTHSLPSGNPVVSGTTITSANENAFRSDISAEITDSLSRSGKGAMTAALELANGTVAAPALSFDSDTDCGLYRIGANNMGLAVNGAKVVDILTTGATVTGAMTSTTAAVTGNATVGGDLAVTGDFEAATVGAGGATILGQVDADSVYLTTADPASTTGYTDTLTPANITKAWAHVTLTGSDGAQTVNSGFNIASATVATVSTFGELTVTFTNGFGSATTFAPVVSSEVGGLIPLIQSKTATTVVLRLWNPGAGAYVVTASLTGVIVFLNATGTQ